MREENSALSNVFQHENLVLGNCIKEVRASSMQAALVVQTRNQLCADVSLKDEELETICRHYDCLQHELVRLLWKKMVLSNI